MTDSPVERASGIATNRLRSKLISALGGQFGTFAVGLVGQIVIARALGPDGKGLLSLTMLVAMSLANIGHLSYGSACSYFIGRQPVNRSSVAGNSLFFTVLWGFLWTALAMLFMPTVRDRFIPLVSDRLLMMATVTVLPLLLLEYGNSMLIGFDRIFKMNLIMVSREMIFVSTMALVWIAGGASVETAIALWGLAILTAGILLLTNSIREVGGLRLDIPSLLAMLRFGISFHLSNVLSFLRSRFDLFIIAFFMSRSEVGYYSLAAAILVGLRYLPAAIGQVLLPYVAQRSDDAGNQMTPLLVRIGFALTLLAGCALVIFGYPLIYLLFGPAFIPAYKPLAVLVPGAVVLTLATMLAGDLIGRGKPHYSVIVSVITFVLNVAAGLILIPRLGIMGAALASTGTHFLTGSMFLYFFLRESGVTARDVLVARREDWLLVRRSLRR
ncbi:MAG: hypothetical protein FJY67_00445 [Calditrichaeota bacterium]|nr:hypothetical protein [Calditrichota bacterium]